MHAAFAEKLANGQAADSAETQALAARHYAWVCRSWTPDATAYAGLGRLYVEHEDFHAMYDNIRPGLAAYLAEAMAVYAARALA
ncbi:TipAS antibiotic-recognition domain-containing protein [Sphingosinicellaceae bacterium A1X5R2]|nr:TipAS antibiotic-recognition domain-containing protein [Pedomonas mirosovicensis]